MFRKKIVDLYRSTSLRSAVQVATEAASALSTANIARLSDPAKFAYVGIKTSYALISVLSKRDQTGDNAFLHTNNFTCAIPESADSFVTNSLLPQALRVKKHVMSGGYWFTYEFGEFSVCVTDKEKQYISILTNNTLLFKNYWGGDKFITVCGGETPSVKIFSEFPTFDYFNIHNPKEYSECYGQNIFVTGGVSANAFVKKVCERIILIDADGIDSKWIDFLEFFFAVYRPKAVFFTNVDAEKADLAARIAERFRHFAPGGIVFFAPADEKSIACLVRLGVFPSKVLDFSLRDEQSCVDLLHSACGSNDIQQIIKICKAIPPRYRTTEHLRIIEAELAKLHSEDVIRNTKARVLMLDSKKEEVSDGPRQIV